MGIFDKGFDAIKDLDEGISPGPRQDRQPWQAPAKVTRVSDTDKLVDASSDLIDYSQGSTRLRADTDEALNLGRAALETRGVKFADVWKAERDAGTDWVAEYREQADTAARNLTALLSRGFEFNDALYIAAAPGILDQTENVENTAEWTQHFLLGEEMLALGPGKARELWDSLDAKTQASLADKGFDVDEVESKISGIGVAMDRIAGVADTVSFGGLNAVGRTLARGVGDTIEMADNIAEQTIQRGYRAIDLSLRQSIEARSGGLTVNDGRVMTDPTAVTAGQQRWHNAVKVVGDGDNTFRPGTFKEMLAIAGDNRDAVEIAQLFAAGKSVDDILERLELPEGDDAARTEAYLQIRELERNPVIQELTTFANRNKLSPGRTVSQLVANDDPMVSGAVDGVWRMFADPFLVGGKFLKMRRLSRALPTDSIGAALPVISQRLGGFVDEVDDLGEVRQVSKLVTDMENVGARANEDGGFLAFNARDMINLVDYQSYNQGLRKLVKDKTITRESAALIELVDHVFAHDGRFLARYLRMRPGNEALAMKVNDLRLALRQSPVNFTPQQEYRLAAQELHDSLLPAAIASGLGYTRRTPGAFMPRLTYGGYLKAQVAPKVNDVIDWTMQKAPIRLMAGSKIGVDDYESAEAFLDEFVRYARGGDIMPTRLDDFGIMRDTLERKGYAPDVIADTLTKRVLVDIGVNETHGLPMDALARYAMSQGDPASPVYDNIVAALNSLEDLDPSVQAQDLVGAFDEAVNRYGEMFAALPDKHWATQGLLQDGAFNRDLNELTSILRGTWMEYAARKAVISPEEVTRLKGIHGEKWVDHVVNPDNADTRGLFGRLARGRKDPTGGAATWDEFYADVIAPLAERGSFRKVGDLLKDHKDALASKYDQDLVEALHWRLSDFRWDDAANAARYKIDSPQGVRYIDDPDAYEEQLTGVLARWQEAEITGLAEDRAKLQGKLNWLSDPTAFGQLGLAAIGKAGRGLTLFTRKIPKFGYVPFQGDHALGEFQKFLDMGVYGKDARRLAKEFVNTTDAGRRSVIFAAKRQLLHDTGILFNPHATDFVLSQLYEADFYYGGLRWIDNQGHARMSALLPDVQTADGMAIPDIELIAFNADRSRVMEMISPVNGELSHLTKRMNNAFKQAAVFAPRLILRAGGLDETMSVVARHGIRDTTRMYAQSTLGRARASTLSRNVQRQKWYKGWGRTGQDRLASGAVLPEANYEQVASLLGNRESFVRRWSKVRAIEEYRAASVVGRTDVDRLDAATRALQRYGLDPKQMDEAVSPEWIDDMVERTRAERQVLKQKIVDGEIPDIMADWSTFTRWADETELEGMFDSRVPVRENTGPGLHDAAKWHGRFADRLINVGNKMGLHMDEDMLRAMNRLATDPIVIHAYNKNVTQTSIVGTLVDLDPTQPISFEELETMLRLRDDTGDFAEGLITDYLGMQYLAVTGQMLNASDLANVPAWGFMGMVPSAERQRIGAQLPDFGFAGNGGRLGDPYGGGATRWHRLFETVAAIPEQGERAFAGARARFAMAPDSYKQLVWDILDDAPNARYAEIDPVVLAAEWRDFVRGHGLDPDEFGIDADMVTELTDFFVKGDRQAGNLVAWNDEAFRPSVAYANVQALRAADTGTFFHGSNAPLQTVRPMAEAIVTPGRKATGPGLYLSQNAPYSAGYAYMAQQLPERGGNAVMNRLRLKPEFADHKIMARDGLSDLEREDLLGSIDNFVAAHADEADPANYLAAEMAEYADAVRNGTANPSPMTLWSQVQEAAISLERDPEKLATIGKALTEDFYGDLGRRGYAAFSDHHHNAKPGALLGDAFDDAENRHLVVFLDDVVDVDDPVNWSMTAEGVESAMLDQGAAQARRSNEAAATEDFLYPAETLTPAFAEPKTRYAEEVDDWAHWVIGDYDPDAGMQRIIETQTRDLLRPENHRSVKRHDMLSPDHDVRYNRSDDFVTVFVPRSKVGRSRIIVDNQSRDAGGQFFADATASQAVLDGGATPSTYDILGSPDPVEAQRLLDFYSNGRPQDWDMVEVIVSKDEWAKRSASMAKDDPRVKYVTDPFRGHANAQVPVGRATGNVDVSPDVESISDAFRQLFAVNATEIDQAQVVTGRLEQAVAELDGTVGLIPSDPGYRPVLAGKGIPQATGELADQMVKSLRGMMNDSFNTPVGQILGPVTRGRFKADMVQDLDVNLPASLIRPRMNASKYAEPDGTFTVINSLRRARDNGFDMIGRGIAEMSRTPQFLRAYGDALRDAKGFRRASPQFEKLDGQVRTMFGDDFDDLAEVLNAELGYATTQISTYAQVSDIADSEFQKLAAHFGVDLDADQVPMFKDWAAGELAWQNLEASQAMTAAFRKTAMFIDDTRVRSQFSQLFDVIWPFTYATEQFLSRWVNTAVHSPEMFRRMALYYQGFYTVGVITEDAQGNDVYEIPFSGQLTKGLAWLTQVLPASMEIDPDLVPGVNMTGRIEYTFAGTTDPLQLSAGPTLALPLAALRPFAPEAVIPFEQLLISELGQGNNPLETVLPSTLGRFTGALRVDESLKIAAMQYVSAYAPELEPDFVVNDDGTIDGPTPAQLDEYQKEVGRVARILHLARGVTGLFSPAAPQHNLDPDNLSEEFTRYLEAGVPIEEAVGRFLADHPGATAYTISKTESAGGAPMDPAQETLDTINANREFFDAYNLAGPYLLPHSGGEAEFDPLAWGELQALNYKTYRTGKEWYRAYSFAVGAQQYFPSRDAKNAALEAAETTEQRQTIRLVWKQWTTDFFAKHPLFADEVSSQEATRRRENVRRDMRKALDDPLLPESENADLVRLLLTTYDEVERLLADDAKYDSDQKKAAKLAFHTWASEKVKGNFMAQAFYDRVILRDLDVDDQPFGAG